MYTIDAANVASDLLACGLHAPPVPTNVPSNRLPQHMDASVSLTVATEYPSLTGHATAGICQNKSDITSNGRNLSAQIRHHTYRQKSVRIGPDTTSNGTN